MFPRWWHGSSALRRTGLILVVAGLLLFACALPAMSLGGDGADAQAVQGWADIFGCSVGLAGLAITLLDRSRTVRRPSQHSLNEAADRLMRQALLVESQQRFRLLGTGRPGTTAANLRYRRAERRHTGGASTRDGDLNTVGRYFTEHTGRRMTILGSPGSGKSVLALELVIQLLDQRREQTDNRLRARMPIPVRCSLSAWNTERQLLGWLAEQTATRFNMPEATATALIDDGRILPVLDGLDEMDEPNGGSRRAIAALEQLNTWVRGRSGAPVVLTCRLDRYRELRESHAMVLRPAVEVTIDPLDPTQIREYLDNEYDSSTDWSLREHWDRLLAPMESGTGGQLLDQLGTPWNLTLAVTYHRDGGNLAALLPTEAERLDLASSSMAEGRYQRRVRDLLVGSFIPARARLHPSEHWTEQQVTDWCRTLASDLGREIDIVPHRLGHRLGDWVRRLHVLVATAATAAFIVCLVAVTSLSKVDAPAPAQDGTPEPGATSVATLLMRLVAMTAVAAFPLLSLRQARRDEVHPSLVNPRQLRTLRGRRKLRESMGRWLVIGMAWGGAFGCVMGLRGQQMEAVGNGLAIGVAICLVFGLSNGLRPIGETTTDPRDPVRNDLVAWIGCGIAVGIAGMVEGILIPNAPGGAVVAAMVSLAAGILLGLVLGLAFGIAGHAWMRYAIAVVGLNNRRQIPIRFGRFLHWAQQAGILRVAGASYQFRHVALRDWLLAEATTGATPGGSPEHRMVHIGR